MRDEMARARLLDPLSYAIRDRSWKALGALSLQDYDDFVARASEGTSSGL